MNLLLLPQKILHEPLTLKPDDPLYKEILRLSCGKQVSHLRAGILNGPRFQVKVHTDGKDFRLMAEGPRHASAPLWPLTVLVGSTRPSGARRIIRSLTELGVGVIGFYGAEKSPAGYLQSSLWQPEKIDSLMHEALAQSYQTAQPKFRLFQDLNEALEDLKDTTIGFLDPYATVSFVSCSRPVGVIVFGGDGGLSDKERQLLSRYEATGFHLGSRILRTDTAIISATAHWGALNGNWNSAQEACFPEDRKPNSM